MKTLELKDIIIDDYRSFYEGVRNDTVIGGEYDTNDKILKLFLTDESTVSEDTIRSYLKSPKVKIVFVKKKLILNPEHRAKVLSETSDRISLLVDPETKNEVIAFVKSQKPDFEESV